MLQQKAEKSVSVLWLYHQHKSIHHHHPAKWVCYLKVSHWTFMVTDAASVTNWGQQAISMYGLNAPISVIG